MRCEAREFTDPNGERERRGYHPGQFDFPRTRDGRWEIFCGAILTQNTAWTNVERALDGLRATRLHTVDAIRLGSCDELGAAIRPAGYFNQKSQYLLAAADWFLKHDDAVRRAQPSRGLLESLRPDLLKVRGVGRETADSILLYAYGLPTFVIDAYTRRVFGRLGLIDAGAGYDQIRDVFEMALAKSNPHDTAMAWQQAHALIVEHAKAFHGRNSDARGDFLLKIR